MRAARPDRAGSPLRRGARVDHAPLSARSPPPTLVPRRSGGRRSRADPAARPARAGAAAAASSRALPSTAWQWAAAQVSCRATANAAGRSRSRSSTVMPGSTARCSAVPGRARSASTSAYAGAYRYQPAWTWATPTKSMKQTEQVIVREPGPGKTPPDTPAASRLLPATCQDVRGRRTAAGRLSGCDGRPTTGRRATIRAPSPRARRSHPTSPHWPRRKHPENGRAPGARPAYARPTPRRRPGCAVHWQEAR